MRLSALYQSNPLLICLQTLIVSMATASIATLLFACNLNTVSQISEDERRFNAINKMLMCPVCPGESIDQSQNALAANMKLIVKKQILDGETDSEILEYFVEKYGVVVLMEPPRDGLGMLAWLVPAAAFPLAVIAVIFSLYLMRRKSKDSIEGTCLGDNPTDNERESLSTVVESAYKEENIR